jgi:hypothetical protein
MPIDHMAYHGYKHKPTDEEMAARMVCAPASSGQLITLGRTLYENSTRTDPCSIGDAAWARWPTEDGTQ